MAQHRTPPVGEPPTAPAAWLELLLRDASVEELTAHGRQLGPDGARQAGQAVQVKALMQERSRRAGELAALNDIAGRLLSMRSPAVLLPEIVAHARQLLRVDLAYLALVHTDRRGGQLLRIEVTDGAITPELVGVELPVESGVAGWVIRNARPRWSRDYLNDRGFPHSSTADAAAGAEHMHGVLGAPLTVRGRAIGALFAADRRPREFSEDEITLLSALAAHAGIAVDNADNLARLEAARDQLDRRSEHLAQSLSWDERLREVVLRGGGMEELLAEVGVAVGGRVRFVSDVGPADAAARPVVAANRRLGWLLPVGCEPTEAGMLALDRAAPTVALTVLAQEAAAEASGRARHLQLVELITADEGVEPRHQDLRLAGLDPASDYCLAVVDGQGAAVAHGVAPWLAALPADSVAVRHHQEAVVVVRSGERALERALSDAGVRAGIAGPVPAAGGLPRAYAEATETLRALRALSEGPRVATAAQLGVYRVLLSETGREHLQAAFARELGRLETEEERRGVPLLATVQAFLDAGRSPRATASALTVHVNTVYQRLAVVDEVLGAGWREPGRALELHVLLRLRAAARGLGDG
ncbi:helix-turn-helix domain-containing protein [Kytococcus sedentarius]|uniref:helix-turn-helix domain-containing protein n=1 Tax=Kytococcus sedentarius TaxID=1276 RepID=UPI0035BC4470